MQVGTVILAILNVILEGSVLLMEEMRVVESRSMILTTLGAVIIFFAFFSIPVRGWWTLVINGVFSIYEVAALLMIECLLCHWLHEPIFANSK